MRVGCRRETSRIPVRYPGGSYDVVVGQGLLPKAADLTGLLGPSLVVTDEVVGPLHAHRLSTIEPMAIISLPAGEQHKNLASVEWLYSQFLAAGLDPVPVLSLSRFGQPLQNPSHISGQMPGSWRLYQGLASCRPAGNTPPGQRSVLRDFDSQKTGGTGCRKTGPR